MRQIGPLELQTILTEQIMNFTGESRGIVVRAAYLAADDTSIIGLCKPLQAMLAKCVDKFILENSALFS